MRACGLLLVAAAICSGCIGVGAGLKYSTDWGGAAALGEPEGGEGVDLSVNLGRGIAGYWIQSAGDEDAGIVYASYELGPKIGRRGGHRWVVFKPMAGVWYWKTSPEESGLFTGVRTAFHVHPVRHLSRWEIVFEYGMAFMNDVSGDEDVWSQTFGVALALTRIGVDL